MSNSLFSSYSQGENRITSTILAVFERLNSSVVEFVLNVSMGDSVIELLKYQNQPRVTDKGSVPDGLITASFAYFIETKVIPNSLKKEQLEGHLRYFEESDYQNIRDLRLIVITPDPKKPQVLSDKEFVDKSIFWFNFDKLVEAINRAIKSDKLLLSEREKYLLNELVATIESEKGLLVEDIKDRVLIVPAGGAIKEYKKYPAYICQENRSFRPSKYLAFYHDSIIDKVVPEILGYIDSVELVEDGFKDADVVLLSGTREGLEKQFEDMIDVIKKNDGKQYKHFARKYGTFNKVIFLSSKENDDRTVKLEKEIENNKKSYSRKNVAFVYKQRYTSLVKLQNAETTSDLE